MSSEHFVVTQHWSPCQFIREYPHAVKSDDAELFLAVKEYRPRDDSGLNDDAVTIIAGHGNGFPKECYEALWDEILNAANGFKIRSIWMAEYANQGASYAKNADALGDDQCWLDHSRDLLLMVNHFRDRMKPPFVGLAHSMGGAQIVGLALMHPRLFHSVVLIDPVIQGRAPPGPNAAMLSSMRREKWDSRAKAEAALSQSPLYKSMDPRCLKAFLAHGLRDSDDGSVALATPKAQEAWSYIRSNFQPIPADTTTVEARNKERLLNPGFEPFSGGSMVEFARGDSLHVSESLPQLRPRSLFLFGEASHINIADQRRSLFERTGSARGGNGGASDGGVEMIIIGGASHLVVFEKPRQVATDVSEWLARETVRWKQEKAFWATIDTGKSKNGMRELSDKWIQEVKKGASVPRPRSRDAAKL
ncbi:alpha/beta-hydrolase [Lentithecium fluviatile CBS 122367]|uniref:Alpha/beta-hydrolase n=1 Tax=Lentithecium fluviatile CBS 122367 TaxID=1168545 RepID=A0A6G1ICW9_9PLEO|nr:alpha/beta-hydrolase [Lentithecium fluviatile CBS 122367]